MEKLTLKAYAVKHKMSLFSVVKLVKSGKVKSVTEKENGEEKGKEITYILLDEEREVKTKGTKKHKEDVAAFDVEKEVKDLILEVKMLKEEVARLKRGSVDF